MSGDQRDRSVKIFKDKLNDSMFESLRSVKFGFLKFGSLCNASESNAFTSARCEIDNIKNEESKPYTIDFKTLFKLGLDLLEKWKTKKKPGLDERNTTAINVLEAFIKEKVNHEKSLTKILFDKKNSEADFTVTLAEHLFRLLAPGRHYVIDKGARGKNVCQCNDPVCAKEYHFGKTGIGHEDVWHGFIDLVLFSKNDATKGGDRWRNIIEVKRSLSRSKFSVMDQAISQTIVFSFLQKMLQIEGNRDIFIPNILISPKEFRVIMYNAENDLLICSQPFNLFTKPDSTGCLEIQSILILWMVLHYETFLEDIKQVVHEGVIENVKAKFHANTNKNVYCEKLKFSVNKFPASTDKGYFPDLESLKTGETVSLDQFVAKFGGMSIQSKGDVPGSKTES